MKLTQNYKKSMNIKYSVILLLIFSAMNSRCQSRSNQDNPLKTRPTAVAGQFYPVSAVILSKEIDSLLENAESRQFKNIRAIITPHAGYVFSGEVAASAFSQIDPERKYERIFLIGASHRVYLNGASINDRENYKTPLGTIEVDVELAKRLIKQNKIFQFSEEADHQEHSLEVQLPFLQKTLKNPFKLVPIIIGTDSKEVLKEIAAALEPYFTPDNLFVISTDFSHYPKYSDAIKVDDLTAKAIISNSSEKLVQVLNDNKKQNIGNLATSLCGASAVLTLLYLSEGKTNLEFHEIQYRNSGDSQYGDHQRVVGYHAIVLTDNQADESFLTLTGEEKKALLKIARSTLNTYIREGKYAEINPEELTSTMKQLLGAFVSLHKNDELRGCIGRFNPDKPLYTVVREMTVSAATQDYRFSKVKPEELKSIEIEISVLSPMKKITNIQEIILGKHGIYIRKNGRSGTFLPQVAVQTGWTVEEFLGNCAESKAGIGWNGWKDKDAEIFIYEAVIFAEEGE